MVCKKCGYSDSKEMSIYGSSLCRVCAVFAPDRLQDFQNYISEKIDWKILETYRKYGNFYGLKQKQGMEKKAFIGNIVTRAPYGYSVDGGKLVENKDASKVYSIFRSFLNKDSSLNSLSKTYGLSVNGIKKILKNRSYLGEIKFAGKIFKGKHNSLIPPDLFYAVQRKLESRSRIFNNSI